MSSIAWIPKSDAAVWGDKTILCLYACAYQATPVSAGGSGGQPKTNHWVFSCAVSQTESVRLDPSPSGANMSIVLMASHKSHLYTDKAVKVVQLNTSGLTVNGFLNLLTSSKYDKYQFSTSGQGCRYWIYSVIMLLQRSGRIQNEAQVLPATEALERVWAAGGALAPAAEQTGMQQGRLWELGQ